MDEKIKAMLNSLTDEQKELARKCKTPEEFIKLAQDNMIELSDEQLELVAGGTSLWNEICGCTCYTAGLSPCPSLCLHV